MSAARPEPQLGQPKSEGEAGEVGSGAGGRFRDIRLRSRSTLERMPFPDHAENAAKLPIVTKQTAMHDPKILKTSGGPMGPSWLQRKMITVRPMIANMKPKTVAAILVGVP